MYTLSHKFTFNINYVYMYRTDFRVLGCFHCLWYVVQLLYIYIVDSAPTHTL